jgi:hypothetical protein
VTGSVMPPPRVPWWGSSLIPIGVTGKCYRSDDHPQHPVEVLSGAIGLAPASAVERGAIGLALTHSPSCKRWLWKPAGGTGESRRGKPSADGPPCIRQRATGTGCR